MLGLYLYNLFIGHESCNVLSILNKLKLQKKLQNVMTNNVFLDKKVKTQQKQNKKSNLNPLADPENEPGTSRTQSWCVTTAPPSQLRVTIVVKLFNCFDALGRNVNKHSRICGPHHFNKFIFFCNIFACMENYIWHFLVFTGVCFTS